MIRKIIADYLKSNNKIVVPELGAFIKREENGSEKIFFIPYLNKDDGMLRSVIKSSLGVSDEEAGDIFDNFYRAVTSKLNAGEEFRIEGVGVLKKDVNGIVSLDADPVVAIVPEAVAAEPVASVVPEPVVKQELVAAMPAVPVEPIPVVAGQEPDRVVEKQTPPVTLADKLRDMQASGGQQSSEVPSQRPVQPSAANPVRPAAAAKPKQPVQPDGRGVGKKYDAFTIIAIVASIIAVGALIFGIVSKNTNKPDEMFFEDQPIQQVDSTQN